MDVTVNSDDILRSDARIRELEAEVERLKSRPEYTHGYDDGKDSMMDEVNILRFNNASLKAEVEARWRDIDRLRDEKAKILSVKSTDGLTSSEWLMRTALAESERDALRGKLEKAEQILKTLSIISTSIGYIDYKKMARRYFEENK